MNPTTLQHPQPEELAAFVSGQAPEEIATGISQHLSECEACRTLADALPADTLLSLLREGAEPVHAKTNVVARAKRDTSKAVTIAPARGAPGLELPAELADNPRYRVLELLGSGGMGAVYKAEHRRMERHVALKVMSAGLMTKPAMVERFQREVKAAARLTHANIVTAYDADQVGDAHFLVMEFVEGLSLAQHVQQRARLPIAQACDYIRQAALGLQHAFERGMVHRDIKPHNLMLTPGGQVKILDFGLARFVREAAGETESPASPATGGEAPAAGLTEVGMLMGTADFIAPEQANNPRRADIRADIYSLGCTLFFLLTGRVPFPEGTAMDKLMAHAEKTPMPLRKLRADVPADLARVVEKMMAKDPAQRYQTPAEAARVLAPFTRQPSLLRRLKRPLAATGLLAAALVAAVVIYVQTDQGEFAIETGGDEDIAVAVSKKGIKIQDRTSNRTYHLTAGTHRIRSGEYDIIVNELPDGIAVSTKVFKLTRGGKERLVVTLQAKGDRQSAKEPDLIRKFGPADKFIGHERVTFTPEDGGWRIKPEQPCTIPLFEIANPGAEDCVVKYRARMKTHMVQGPAYLEMLCRFPGKGEAFSRGLFNPVSGTTTWKEYEIPFFLDKGQRPDLIKLNLVIEGKRAGPFGHLWIKDIEVRRAPLPLVSPFTKDLGKRIKAFQPTDKPLTTDRVVRDGDGWRIDSREKEFRTIHLFEVPAPRVDNCVLIYRLQMKSSLVGSAYQEMWCRFPKATDDAPIEGEFFSKGFDRMVSGNTDWTTYLIHFKLEKNQRPDLVKLDLVVGGMGRVWIKNVELVQVPLVP